MASLKPQQVPLVVDSNLLMQEESYLYDPGAERAVLACIVQKPALLMEAERAIRHEWFFFPLHQYIYRVLVFVAQACTRNGWALTFDDTTILSVAKQIGPEFVDNFIRRTEGMAKWREIVDYSKYVALDAFPRHLATMKDRAARVKMFRKGRSLQVSAMDMEANPDASQVASKYEGELSRIAFGMADDDEGRLILLGDVAEEAMWKTRLVHEHPHRSLFHLRHPRFEYWMDLMGGGFRRNSLTVVCARPKVGKTTLLLEIASDFACMGIPALVLDTEMSSEEIYFRELSHLAMFDEHGLLGGKYLEDNNHRAAVAAAVERIKGAPLYYTCIAGKPIDYATSIIRQFRNQHVGTETIPFEGREYVVSKPCIVIYDWIKIPSVAEISRGVAEYQLLGEIASKLKQAALAMHLPIVAGVRATAWGSARTSWRTSRTPRPTLPGATGSPSSPTACAFCGSRRSAWPMQSSRPPSPWTSG